VATVRVGLPPQVINPRTAPTATVFERQTYPQTKALPPVLAPTGTYRIPTPVGPIERIPVPPLPSRDTDWDEVYDQYVELNKDPPVAIDWGDIAGQVVGGLVGGAFDPFGFGGAAQQFVSGPPAAPPRTVTVDTITGKVTPCRRRRRRKMLTEGDFNTLLRISTLPNTKLVQLALAKAIR